MAKPNVTYELDDNLSVADNLRQLGPELDSLHPKLGPMLASFLAELMDNPGGDKSVMLTALRTTLDPPPVKPAEQDGAEQ